MECSICKKPLDHENADKSITTNGHYAYGSENYCEDCWEKRKTFIKDTNIYKK